MCYLAILLMMIIMRLMNLQVASNLKTTRIYCHQDDSQIKGTITFREACEELKVRCEVAQVHDMMNHPVKGGKKVKGLGAKVKDSSSGKDDLEEMTEQLSEKVFGMISTMVKRQNAAGAEESPEIKH